MKQTIYYANGGSGNHGCEAIIRSLEAIINPKHKSICLTPAPAEDIKYNLSEIVELKRLNDVSKHHFDYLKAYFRLKTQQSQYALDLYPYDRILKSLSYQNNYIALSVGGDNYCYGGTGFYAELDNLFHRNGIRTAMIGCSIEPDVISKAEVQKDLKSHSLIIARESITYAALMDFGINNAILLPDPAFLLAAKPAELPIGFSKNNTIGINLSPQVNKCSLDGNIVSRNIEHLISYIIANTDAQIALIPHVVWNSSNDYDTLMPLYEKYKNSGRLILIPDSNAEELKGYISQCRLLIASRTHASIAAYSTCVPTLVIGYSVKAKGIAKDIFGTDTNYVIPSQLLRHNDDLINSFKWLCNNESSIRKHLTSFMPDYCKKAYQIKYELDKIR